MKFIIFHSASWPGKASLKLIDLLRRLQILRCNWTQSIRLWVYSLWLHKNAASRFFLKYFVATINTFLIFLWFIVYTGCIIRYAWTDQLNVELNLTKLSWKLLNHIELSVEGCSLLKFFELNNRCNFVKRFW